MADAAAPHDRGRDAGTGLDQSRDVLALQQAEQLVFRLFRQASGLGQCLENADMAKINTTDRQFDPAKGTSHQADDSQVGRDIGIAIQLGANLQGLTTGGDGRRQGMQRAVAVTQASHTLMVEQVSIDTRSLRRDVGTHPHGPPGQLIHQLEGAQLEILAGPGQ